MKMKEKTSIQIGNDIYRKQCLEHNKTASKCNGKYYLSGNRRTRSGYEYCKYRERCPYYIYDGWNDSYITFGSVSDFRSCDKVPTIEKEKGR
jgi:hypothetical protein